MDDIQRPAMEAAEKNGLEDDDLELSLGLGFRPATIRRPKTAIREGSGDLSLMTVPISGSEKESEGLGLELEAKKEAQALRRQEARKKREEKRKFKANAVAGNSKQREIEDDFSKRRRKNETPCYMIMPGLVRSDSNGGFRPYHHLVPDKNSGNGGCSRGSSPGVSDYRTTSGQGGSSSDGGSHSSHSNPPEHSPSAKPAPKPEAETEPSPCKNPERSRSPAKETKVMNPSKPPKPPAATQQATNSEAMLLSQMPYVSATGNGPNGKTVTGFLYKYTNSEVCIVCVCHGTSFTPAGFVEHAGAVDVENPLRHITVVPFAFT